MAKILNTVWAFLLHIIGVTIFQTCFANAIEDWDGESLLTGPCITSFFFAFGIYIIILKISLFPSTFRKPPIALLSIYEFLATAFFLEFSMSCIWTPIDIIIMITMPRKTCQILVNFEYIEVAEWVSANRIPMIILCYAVSSTFLYFSLYITRSLDFSIINKCGMASFGSHVKNTFWNRITSELPTICQDRRRPSRGNRERRRGRSRDSNISYSDYEL